MSILNVKNLTKKFRSTLAVDDISFDVKPGEFVGLIGPNGAGKSTLMNCTVGRILPGSGSIRVNGIDVVQDTLGARRALGFVPQDLDLHGYLTGEEYLFFIGELRGVPKERLEEEAHELLELCEIMDARHRVVKEYSGGMARKLAISGALMGSPPLLLLDESFVGLDPESTWKIRERLRKHCEHGGAILLSSHILEMLERVCTRIVMMKSGKIVLDEEMTVLKRGFDQENDLTRLYLELAGKLEITQTSPPPQAP